MTEVIAGNRILITYFLVLPLDDAEAEMTRYKELYVWPAIEKTYHVDLMSLSAEERGREVWRLMEDSARSGGEEKKKWSLGVPERKEEFEVWMKDEKTGKPVPVAEERENVSRKVFSRKHPPGKRKPDDSTEKDD